jgi:hypothetical protein
MPLFSASKPSCGHRRPGHSWISLMNSTRLPSSIPPSRGCAPARSSGLAGGVLFNFASDLARFLASMVGRPRLPYSLRRAPYVWSVGVVAAASAARGSSGAGDGVGFVLGRAFFLCAVARPHSVSPARRISCSGGAAESPCVSPAWVSATLQPGVQRRTRLVLVPSPRSSRRGRQVGRDGGFGDLGAYMVVR